MTIDTFVRRVGLGGGGFTHFAFQEGTNQRDEQVTDKSVSIIIPCFNNAAFVAEAIESALKQTHDKIQVVVVDDGSTDGSGDVISTFCDRIVHLTQENFGACVARNKGISYATGSYVKFLDADDILMPKCVETQLKQVGNRDVIVFGDHVNLSPSNMECEDRAHSIANNVQKSDLASLETFLSKPILTSTTLYKKTQLTSVEGFDPARRRGQEFDLHLRLYASGVDFEYHPMICYKYRQHESSSRISKENFGKPIYDAISLQVITELMRDGPRRNEWSKNRVLLAKQAWVVGRNLLRQGERSEAILLFSLSKSLAGRKGFSGSLTYTALTSVLGPELSEWLLSAGKKAFLR